ncbi:hypothetical protein BME27_21200 [Klebsiella pneumoniae]|nr:hypothetical protein BME92_08265 [Klebsiella pneumoniae]OVT96487.1 hypothetical protein BMD98_21230 [Klebsiella pneumoniae]OVU38412.1 hypothetical protein BME16_21405 [Klebsiella pneumoniae]OVU48895.1 hypothetical protein BME15_20585 [Klebsiella pneumoniae]OVU64228.1 hypothetical protein BME11_21520 [Klebsiella pneumoniae]
MRGGGSNNVQKFPVCGAAEFEASHTFASLVKSAIFVAIHPFFFPTDLSKMQKSTFIKQKLYK